MTETVRVAPSILSADMANLERELSRVSNADFIHFDVMDGHFTPNLTFGPEILRAAKRVCDLPFDVHMMVANPDESAEWYADAGADIVTVHVEASRHLNRTVRRLRERGVRAGAVLNPSTPVEALTDIVGELDLVLLMSVNPGFGGQAFIERTHDKLRRLRALCDREGASPLIEVDGGISAANAAAVTASGANVLVAGSAVFGAPDPAAAVDAIREEGSAGLAARRA